MVNDQITGTRNQHSPPKLKESRQYLTKWPLTFRSTPAYKSKHTANLLLKPISATVLSKNDSSHQAQSPQHHDRLLPLFPPPLSSLYAPVLLLIPALLSASNLSIPSLVACNTLSCLSHIANGRLGCAMNSSAPKAFPDGECTIPPLDAFGEING